LWSSSCLSFLFAVLLGPMLLLAISLPFLLFRLAFVVACSNLHAEACIQYKCHTFTYICTHRDALKHIQTDKHILLLSPSRCCYCCWPLFLYICIYKAANEPLVRTIHPIVTHFIVQRNHTNLNLP